MSKGKVRPWDGPIETGDNNSSQAGFNVDPSVVYKLYVAQAGWSQLINTVLFWPVWPVHTIPLGKTDYKRSHPVSGQILVNTGRYRRNSFLQAFRYRQNKRNFDSFVPFFFERNRKSSSLTSKIIKMAPLPCSSSVEATFCDPHAR